MGTRGLVVYRYRGRYYAHYNHWDSYPTGLGLKVVSQVPQDPDEYQRWLEQMREKYGNLEEELESKYWSIDPTMIQDCQGTLPSDETLETDYDLVTAPSILPPANDLWIEWVYTFDLDNEVVSIQNTHHFSFSNIPNDWLAPFGDGEYRETREWPLFSYTSTDDHPATVTLEREPVIDQSVIEKFDRMSRRVVQTKSLSGLKSGKRSAVNFAKRLHQAWVDRLDNLSFLMVQWDPNDHVFRDMCFATLCLIADPQTTLSLQHSDSMTLAAPQFAVIHDPVLDNELVTDLFQPFHVAGRTRRFCPSDDVFWMHKVLVYPCNRLDIVDNAKAGIVRLVEGAANKGVTTFYGVVMSVSHVILVRLFADGRIEHTRPIKFFSDVSDGDVPPVPQADGLAVDDQTDGFVAIAHVFEAAQRAELPLEKSPALLPPELLGHIVDQVDDRSTWLNCLQVSRLFRDQCQKRYVVHNHTNLVDRGHNGGCTLHSLEHGQPACYSFNPSELPLQSPSSEFEEPLPGPAMQFPVIGVTRGQRVILYSIPFQFLREDGAVFKEHCGHVAEEGAIS